MGCRLVGNSFVCQYFVLEGEKRNFVVENAHIWIA